MADRGSLSPAVLARIARTLKSAGLPDEACDSNGLAAVLQRIFETYDDNRTLLSRDTLPTAPELALAIRSVREHLEAILRICAGNIHVAVWLDEYASRERSADLRENRGPFEDAFFRCLHVARDADEHFSNAVDRGGTLLVVRGDRSVEHRRRTRTESRDTVLIPYLVGWLSLAGLQFRERDDWNLEALDAACEIISIVLSSWGIPAPDAGDTAKGEVNQGRLRRAVKDSWLMLQPLTTTVPESPA